MSAEVVGLEQEVDDGVNGARASLAMLKLQLRAAQREANEAERATRAGSGDVMDLVDAQQWLRATMGSWIEARRLAMDDELDAARAEGRRTVDAARSEGRALVAAARDEVLHLLGDDADEVAVDVVADQGPAGGDIEECVPLADEPGPVAEPAPGPVAQPAVGPEHEPAPAPVAELTAQVVLPPPGLDRGPSIPDVGPTRPLASRFMYLDVILPFVAVVIVVVVLLAWLG